MLSAITLPIVPRSVASSPLLRTVSFSFGGVALLIILVSTPLNNSMKIQHMRRCPSDYVRLFWEIKLTSSIMVPMKITERETT